MILEECDEAGGACGLQVASLVSGGAAESSGIIKAGDRLVAVEGRDVRYGTFDGVMDLLVGKPNTEALLSFERLAGANEAEVQPAASVAEGGMEGDVNVNVNEEATRVVDVGSSIGQGRRRTQEDALVVGTLSEDAADPLQKVLVAGVFDGHRTAEASSFAAERWIPTLRTSLAATVTHTLVAAEATDSSPPSTAFTRTGEAEALTVANAWRRLCDDYLESEKVGGATGEIVT